MSLEICDHLGMIKRIRWIVVLERQGRQYRLQTLEQRAASVYGSEQVLGKELYSTLSVGRTSLKYGL